MPLKYRKITLKPNHVYITQFCMTYIMHDYLDKKVVLFDCSNNCLTGLTLLRRDNIYYVRLVTVSVFLETCTCKKKYINTN